MTLFQKTSRSSYCEWKGTATYYAVSLPSSGKEQVVRDRCWSYGNPTSGFKPIRDYISFYVGPWNCFVDGEQVQAQPGDF